MNTQEMRGTFFPETATISDLTRTMRRVMAEWLASRNQTRIAHKLDFREIPENEMTDKMRAALDVAQNAPEEDFITI